VHFSITLPTADDAGVTRKLSESLVLKAD